MYLGKLRGELGAIWREGTSILDITDVASHEPYSLRNSNIALARVVSWLSVVLYTERSQAGFLVRASARVLGSIPNRCMQKAANQCFSLTSMFLPLSQRRNNSFFFFFNLGMYIKNMLKATELLNRARTQKEKGAGRREED